MDDIQLPGTLPDAPPPMDPATRAFTELKGELALLRRAIEHVAAEKADIERPDYSNTLAKLAKAVIALHRFGPRQKSFTHRPLGKLQLGRWRLLGFTPPS